jgi:dipeptidase E
MKLLLTSAGITNASLRAALERLLGRPIADSHALCIPTATYSHPQCGPQTAWRFVSGQEPRCPMAELGWRSVGLLELTALPWIDRERWVGWVRQADALLVNGGDALFLAHWMRQSGLTGLLDTLPRTVWVGLSAGSMVMTPRVGDAFIEQRPPLTGSDAALGVVDFSLFPHLDHPELPENTMAHAERWAAGLGGPAYAIDDQTALQVLDGRVTVVSEGRWRRFGPPADASAPAPDAAAPHPLETPR